MNARHTYQGMRVAILVVSILLVAVAGFADSVRVIADRSTIWRNPTGTAGVIEIAKAGTVLEVRGRQGRWLLVESSFDPRQIGYILASQTEPTAQSPGVVQAPRQEFRVSPEPQARPAPTGQTPPSAVQTRAARRPAKPADRPRPFLYGGLTIQVSALHLHASDARAFLLEQGARDTTYRLSNSPGFEIGAGFGIAHRLMLSGLFARRSGSGTASVLAEIPHPIFFATPRPLTGEFRFFRADTAAHMQIAVTAYQNARFLLIAGGGPSFFLVEQDLLDQLRYTEAYPYDAVSYAGATASRHRSHALGGNVQFDAIVSLSRRYSSQTSIRWSQGSVKFDGISGHAVTGHGQVSTGVRIAF